jgi:hypothetical protein
MRDGRATVEIDPAGGAELNAYVDKALVHGSNVSLPGGGHLGLSTSRVGGSAVVTWPDGSMLMVQGGSPSRSQARRSTSRSDCRPHAFATSRGCWARGENETSSSAATADRIRRTRSGVQACSPRTATAGGSRKRSRCFATRRGRAPRRTRSATFLLT